MASKVRLPVDEYLTSLRQAWSERKSLIVKAAPGSGKTTRIPALLADHSEKIVVVLEPRRLAARLSAEWVASEHGSSVGDFCGFQIRFDRKFSPATKLLFVTEGIFLNMLISDPALSRVGTVVIDEFHERHINTDIALAVCRKLQETSRPDLKLVIMSATIDTQQLESYLAGAEVFDIPGTTYPVGVSYFPGPTERPSPEHLAMLAANMVSDPACPGNILVFATGAREIRDIVTAVASTAAGKQVDVFALSADSDRADQDRIFAAGGRRRIVVSTNVAETSLTIPGITGVIDNGLAKISGYAEWSGMGTLDIRKVSKASCVQRAGRAGRTAPGVCYRAFAEADFLGRAAFTVPEINRSDLAELVLSLSTIGVITRCDSDHVAKDMTWLELPDTDHLQAAIRYLELTGALENGRLTPLGRAMAGLPLPPRLAAALVRGREAGIGDIAAAAVAIAGESGIHRFNGQPPVVHDSDVEYQSECLLRFITGDRLSHAEMQYLDMGKMRSAARVWTQLTGKKSPSGPKISADEARSLRRALVAAYPDRIGQRNQSNQRQGATYGFATGGGGLLSRASVLNDVELLIALEGTLSHARSGDVGVTIDLACGIEPADLSAAPPSLRQVTRAVRWNDKAKRSEVVISTSFGGITLEAKTLPPQSAEEKNEASVLLADWLRVHWEEFTAGDEYLSQFMLRSRLLADHRSDGFPVLDGEMRELFIAIIADSRWSVDSLGGQTLKSLVAEQLSWEESQALEKLTPEVIVLSGQRKFPVSYRDGAPPIVRGYIQDFYGNPGDITILDGRVIVSVELLGPNKRPIQITASLKNFWSGTYHQLKPELSRNYPKHHWPDKPESAPPVLLKSRLNK
jgi:ATP-dependent helicase HrpB